MKRQRKITLRLTDQEWQVLQMVAQHADKSISWVVRQSLRNMNVEISYNGAPLLFLKALNAIGNNLNQIARHLNSGNPIDTAVLLTLSDIEERLEALRSRYAR